jgi:hypothetical protein
MDMRFGTWHVKSPYRTGSSKTVVRELGKYKQDLVSVLYIRSDRKSVASKGQRIIHFSVKKGMGIIS